MSNAKITSHLRENSYVATELNIMKKLQLEITST